MDLNACVGMFCYCVCRKTTTSCNHIEVFLDTTFYHVLIFASGLMVLVGIIDDFKNDIDEELGILYFDHNLCEWRNKETEKNLDNYLN